MQDLSQVTGSQTILKIAGKEYLVGGFTFEDIGALQGECLKAKRKAKLEVALAMRDILPPAEFDREWDRARDEAGNVALIADDFDKYLRNTGGLASIFWILIERQYPGQVTRQQIKASLENSEITNEAAAELMLSLEALEQRGKKSS